MKIEKLKLGRFFRSDGNFKKFDPKLHGIEIVQKIDEIIDHLNSEGEKKPIYITNYQDRVENFGNIPKPDKECEVARFYKKYIKGNFKLNVNPKNIAPDKPDKELGKSKRAIACGDSIYQSDLKPDKLQVRQKIESVLKRNYKDDNAHRYSVILELEDIFED